MSFVYLNNIHVTLNKILYLIGKNCFELALKNHLKLQVMVLRYGKKNIPEPCIQIFKNSDLKIFLI